VLSNKNFLQTILEEKDKHIKRLESDLNYKTKSFTDGNSAVTNKINPHDIKLAIHSCLSVANVFQQKFDAFNTAKEVNEKLNESFNNIKDNNFDQILDCLKHLEEWINIVCKELDVSIFFIPRTAIIKYKRVELWALPLNQKDLKNFLRIIKHYTKRTRSS
jgi:hypothetical protein